MLVSILFILFIKSINCIHLYFQMYSSLVCICLIHFKISFQIYNLYSSIFNLHSCLSNSSILNLFHFILFINLDIVFISNLSILNLHYSYLFNLSFLTLYFYFYLTHQSWTCSHLFKLASYVFSLLSTFLGIVSNSSIVFIFKSIKVRYQLYLDITWWFISISGATWNHWIFMPCQQWSPLLDQYCIRMTKFCKILTQLIIVLKLLLLHSFVLSLTWYFGYLLLLVTWFITLILPDLHHCLHQTLLISV